MFSAKYVKITQRFGKAGFVAVLLAAAACGSASGGASSSDSSCPNNAPQSCPAEIPSYSHDVAPIIQQACVGCHGPGGVESVLPLQDYNDVFGYRESVLAQVASCRMPKPGDSVTLDANDRLTLLTWLVCSAPNN